jgi:hypothetical protein
MHTYLLMFALAFIAPQEGQERPKVPKDSMRVLVTGCLKGRMLAVDDARQPDVQSGFPIKARSFRLAGKKDVMDEVKKHDKHLVEVDGIVKLSALSEPGLKIGKGVTIGGGPPTAGSGTMPPPPTENIPVMDVSSVQVKANSCGAR